MKPEYGEQVDARKTPLDAAKALALLDQVTELYAAKGKNVLHYDLKKKRPADEELLTVLLGPTGNLRAPTLRKGKTLVVGYNRGVYEKVFG